jgi:hypothetical protein
MPRSDRPEASRLHKNPLFLPIAAALLFPVACSNDREPDLAVGSPAAEPAPAAFLPAIEDPGHCPDGGRLVATLIGALEGDIDWHAADMSCEGMPRPAGAGARLRFAGSAGEAGLALAIIIAVPRLQPGVPASDLPANVTIIEEGKGRFFSTTDLDYCWVDVDHAGPAGDDGTLSPVAGTLSCIAPLAETNGTTSVTVGELSFRGFVDWSGA